MPEVILKGEKRYKKLLKDYEKALNYFFKENFAEAKKILEKIISSEEEEKELIKKAKVYLRLCEQRLNPPKPELKNAEDQINYAVYLLNKKEFEEAEKALLKALKLDTNQKGRISYLLSVLYALKNEEEKSIQFLKEAIKIDPIYKIYASTNTDYINLYKNKEFKKLVKRNKDKENDKKE